jgi:hypothetical protein
MRIDRLDHLVLTVADVDPVSASKYWPGNTRIKPLTLGD